MSIKLSGSVLIVSGLLVTNLATYFFTKQQFNQFSIKEEKDIITSANTTAACGYNIDRLKGYKYIKPLVYGEPSCESGKLADLKNRIGTTIDNYKKSGTLISASVYLRDYKRVDWLSINDTETYLPGSLIKVAGLVAYLRMAEDKPGLLEKKLTFESPKEFIPNQTFNSKQIQLGKSYTIKELLKYMIAYSDNNATYLLNKNVDIAVFQKMFIDLNIPAPDLNNPNYKITAKDYSAFLKAIYNAGYLTINDSEFAAELLGECDFNEGFVKELPQGTLVAHKFGEMGDATSRQLHESALIYINDTPYLLTVMTKGYDIKKLPEVLSSISKQVYDSMKEREADF